MAAAYAALVSLLNTMDNILNHPRLSISLDKNQVQSLCDTIDFLLAFIETDSDGVRSGDAQVLETEIASAAYAAEDVIESHVVDQIQAGSVSLLDLQRVIRDIDCVKEKVVVNVKEQRRFQLDVQPTYGSSFCSSSTPHHLSNNKMVGFDDELTRLLEELTGQQSALQIISIVGMGGIGKTTLATTVYEHPLISHKFDVRSWVTISQQYSVREIFSKLLSCKSGEIRDEHKLGELLYKSLIGRRYLIVLDDIWSLEAWHKIKRFFPDNNNTSRILVTTRLSDMAAHLGTSLLALKFLDEAESWELFCEKARPRVQGCLGEFEEIGKKIAKKCKGLPLLISVIGALVSKSSSMEYWDNILQKMNSILDPGDESLDILSLSYGHLPAHLKPCFLYMGVFPEDHEIRVSRLIKLWVSEGFIKPNKSQSLEDIAEGYLKDLIDWNLILTRRWSRSDGKMETCQMHDLLRDLCLKIAVREKFLCVLRFNHDVRQGIDKERRVVFHERIPEPNYRFEFRERISAEPKYEFVFHERVTAPKYLLLDRHGLESASLTRSLVSIERLPIKFKLLRVLDIYDASYQWVEIIKQVNLRYVCIPNNLKRIEYFGRVLSSISLLWNLQTLILRCLVSVDAPSEIWEMPQLRHVDIGTDGVYLPDPPIIDERQDDQLVLRNLQTLKRVLGLGLKNHDEVFKRIPNVKELEIHHSDNYEYFTYDFGRLHKLESLELWCRKEPNRVDLLQCLTFPGSLKKLTLASCNLDWEDLTMIGALPNLEVLRLHANTVKGSEWSPVDGQFLRLKFLKIDDCGDLIKWNAESAHFPVLEKLVLHGLKKLNEIPWGIGEITTLGLIDLIDCSDAAAISAMEILTEQESFGNEGLVLRIMFGREDDLKRFKKEKAQQIQDCTSTGLQICKGKRERVER